MQKSFLILALSVLWGSIYAQFPEGYYDNANGLSGTELKAALHNIIKDHTEINYTNARYALEVLDEDPNNSDNISLIHKGTSIPKTDFNAIGSDGWNREHLWPQSHGDFGTTNGPGTDLHALRPADESINTSRSDKDFDNGGEPHAEATGCLFTTDTWQVRDAVKGDVARAIFYMATRYEGDVSDEPDLIIQNAITGTSGPDVGYLGVLEALLGWHASDPVDQAEIDRNDTIYSNYQSNKNPFVDHPEYVAMIWNAGVEPEPSNHASDFSAHTITLNWTDATGDVLPDAYLVRMSETSFEDIQTPPDGTEISDDFYNKNVAHGIGKSIFGSLTPSTMYYFKIYGYTGSGSSIDYKNGDGVMQINLMAN